MRFRIRQLSLPSKARLIPNNRYSRHGTFRLLSSLAEPLNQTWGTVIMLIDVGGFIKCHRGPVRNFFGVQHAGNPPHDRPKQHRSRLSLSDIPACGLQILETGHQLQGELQIAQTRSNRANKSTSSICANSKIRIQQRIQDPTQTHTHRPVDQSQDAYRSNRNLHY
jgi:hypothetical protein